MARLSRIAAFVIGCLLAGGATYAVLSGKLNAAYATISGLDAVVETKNAELLGYTKYTSYLTVGKQTLAGQMKFLAATVRRPEGETRLVTKSWLGVPFTGVVQTKYDAEYSVGFDLASGSYDIRPTAAGIEIVIDRPTIIATPAVTNLNHAILSGSWPAKVQQTALLMQQEASARAIQQGPVVAADPAVRALCEQRLISFFYEFLAKQPGVKTVPQISISYRRPAP